MKNMKMPCVLLLINVYFYIILYKDKDKDGFYFSNQVYNLKHDMLWPLKGHDYNSNAQT